jgi:hypothetical protein
MSILVQREFKVPRADRAEFERQSREGLWPAFLHFGALMVAYGTWGFGGSGEYVLTHTVYADFDHWLATRAGRGAFYDDPAMLEETKELRPIFAQRGRLVESSQARVIDLDDAVSQPQPRYRKPGEPLVEAPPTFGAGSVVSERTYALAPGSEADFLRISRDHIWPWLAQQGGRLIGFGRDPLATPNEVLTLFAFPSLPAWHRLSRPGADVQPPADVLAAWAERERLVERQSGRLLIVGTEFGTKA